MNKVFCTKKLIYLIFLVCLCGCSNTPIVDSQQSAENTPKVECLNKIRTIVDHVSLPSHQARQSTRKFSPDEVKDLLEELRESFKDDAQENNQNTATLVDCDATPMKGQDSSEKE